MLRGLALSPDFILKSSIALGLGAVIGLERQLRNHEAGLKTNALVALGTALFTTIGLHFKEPDRVIAQIVSGIGFLGAGMILRDGIHVRGLNTAATLWCSAAIGMLVGVGDESTATQATVLVVGANIVLRLIADHIDKMHARREEMGQAAKDPAKGQ